MPKLISIGRIIDESWELYRARFSEFMSVASWLLLLAILYIISLALYPSASTLWFSNDLSTSENIGILLFAFTNYVVAPLLGLWVLIALSRLTQGYLQGKNVGIKLAHEETKPLFFPTLVVSLMVAFLLVVAMLIGFGPPIILASLGALFNNVTLIGIGDMLLVIGIFVALILSFKWMIEYYFSPIATVLDGIQGKKALIQSRKLIQGRFWRTFLRLVVPKLVFIIFGVFIMFIVATVTEVLLGVASGLSLDLHLRIKTLVESIFPILIAVLINPLIINADILLYRALKGEDVL
ncbi:hypothetical protein HYV69_03700 [Candidatus Uhrbacteria bacterium]|nr:hypothetical protein [Candidatus Uhrbacteria bacterium]